MHLISLIHVMFSAFVKYFEAGSVVWVGYLGENIGLVPFWLLLIVAFVFTLQNIFFLWPQEFVSSDFDRLHSNSYGCQ